MPTQGIQQGFLEASNVDLATRWSNMIDAQRSFQLASQARSRPRTSSWRSPTRSAASIDDRTRSTPASLPPDVRRPGPEAQQLYAAALAFEQHAHPAAHAVARRPAQAAERADDAASSGDATTSMYKQMLPDAIAQGVTAGGGLGLAGLLYRRSSGSGAGEVVSRPHRPPRAAARVRAAAARDRDRAARRDPPQDVEGVLARLADVQGRDGRRAHAARAGARRPARPGVAAASPPGRATLDLDDARSCSSPRPTRRARARSPPSSGPARRDRPHPRPEPRPDPPGALVPRPPDARPLGHAAGRLLGRRRLDATPQIRQPSSTRGPEPMPISTFFGLETALRGILAQQRALDVTGHNIANANTVGYTRQEPDGARRRLHRPRRHPPAAGRAARHGRRRPEYHRSATTSSTSSCARRSMRQGYAGEAGRPRPGRARAREPSRHRPELAARQVLVRLAGRRERAREPGTRQALVAGRGEPRRRLPAPSRRSSRRSSRRPSQNVTYTLDEINSIGTQIAQLNVAIADAIARRHAERPARPARPADRPARAARQRHRRPPAATARSTSPSAARRSSPAATLAATRRRERPARASRPGKLAGLVGCATRCCPATRRSSTRSRRR